jgi:hypothetical protein
MRGSRLALVGLCVALAAGCGDNLRPAQADAGFTPPQADAAPPSGAAILFAATPQEALQGAFKTTFPLYETRAITVMAQVPDAPGPRILRLEISNASGTRVRTITRAYASDSGIGTTVSDPASGVSFEVERATVTKGLAQVEIVIAVGGTELTRYGLAGTYRAELFLEATQPVSAATFELRGDQ